MPCLVLPCLGLPCCSGAGSVCCFSCRVCWCCKVVAEGGCTSTSRRFPASRSCAWPAVCLRLHPYPLCSSASGLSELQAAGVPAARLPTELSAPAPLGCACQPLLVVHSGPLTAETASQPGAGQMTRPVFQLPCRIHQRQHCSRILTRQGSLGGPRARLLHLGLQLSALWLLPHWLLKLLLLLPDCLKLIHLLHCLFKFKLLLQQHWSMLVVLLH